MGYGTTRFGGVRVVYRRRPLPRWAADVCEPAIELTRRAVVARVRRDGLVFHARLPPITSMAQSGAYWERSVSLLRVRPSRQPRAVPQVRDTCGPEGQNETPHPTTVLALLGRVARAVR